MKQTAFQVSKSSTTATIANETPVVGNYTGFETEVVTTTIQVKKEGAFVKGKSSLQVNPDFQTGFSAMGTLSVSIIDDDTACIQLLDDAFGSVEFDCNDIQCVYTQF